MDGWMDGWIDGWMDGWSYWVYKLRYPNNKYDKGKDG